MTVKMSGDFGASDNKPTDPNAPPAGTPDSFLDPSERALFWLSRHWHWLALGAALIVGGYTYNSYTKAAARERAAVANNLLRDAETAYDNALAAGPYASPERRKAMEEALAKTSALAAQHGDTKVVRHGEFLAGNAWLAMGDLPSSGTTNTSKALAAFRDYVTKAQTPMERAKGTLAIGNALENEWFLTQDAAKLDEAIKAYGEAEKLATGDAGFLGTEARVARARLLGASGKRDEAIEQLRAVMKELYAPLANPADFELESARTAQNLRAKLQERTLAGEVRRELELLGVDSMKEFPAFAEAKVDDEAK